MFRARGFATATAALVAATIATSTFADLKPSAVYTGTVGVSVSGVGGNSNPVGNLTATIPAGSTILKAYLYEAGTPYPWFTDSPRTIADYNGAGIKIDGTAVTDFDTILGATSTRLDIGNFYTGRADVTALVQSKLGAGSNYSWAYSEGTKNTRIDGGVLAIIYSNPTLPQATVAFLDGGQKTDGETTTVSFSPIDDPTAVGFVANMGIADSFSTGKTQTSIIKVNDNQITAAAGGFDDGKNADGALITVGGTNKNNANPTNPNSTSAADDELYTLVPYLKQGDTGFTLFTDNPSNDDNIFFMYMNLTAQDVVIGTPPPAPEPASLGVLAIGAAGLLMRRRRR